MLSGSLRDMSDHDSGSSPSWRGPVPLSAVLTHMSPAYGDSWEKVLPELWSSDPDAAVVEELARELLADGRFRFPIHVDVEDGRVANGMHRVAATVLAGHDTIEVTDVPAASHEECVHLVMQIAAVPDDLDALTDALDRLRSFPLADTWVESDVYGLFGDVLDTEYYCPHRLAGALVDHLTAGLASVGARAEEVAVTPTSIHDEDVLAGR